MNVTDLIAQVVGRRDIVVDLKFEDGIAVGATVRPDTSLKDADRERAAKHAPEKGGNFPNHRIRGHLEAIAEYHGIDWNSPNMWKIEIPKIDYTKEVERITADCVKKGTKWLRVIEDDRVKYTAFDQDGNPQFVIEDPEVVPRYTIADLNKLHKMVSGSVNRQIDPMSSALRQQVQNAIDRAFSGYFPDYSPPHRRTQLPRTVVGYHRDMDNNFYSWIEFRLDGETQKQHSVGNSELHRLFEIGFLTEVDYNKLLIKES